MFFFIFSSSLLKLSLYSSILFPNAVSILITNALNLYLLFTLVSLAVFSGFFLLFFQLSHTPLSSHFNLTFSVSIKLYRIVTNCFLEGVSLYGSIHILPVCLVALVGELDLA